MSSTLPWTKFQDFYLRLGFLKVLVAVLGGERRSVPAEAIVRRARSPLFDPLTSAPALAALTARGMSWYERDTSKEPSVAEGLIVDANLPSLLYALTGPTTYKMLDWGRDAGFVGRGNQISERGLLLRALGDMVAADAFVGGDVTAWNPFRLSGREKLFLLYHLLDIDGVTAGIVDAVGRAPAEEVFDIGPASRIMAQSLNALLRQAAPRVRPPDIPALRTALELAATISAEVGVDAVETGQQRRAPPRPVRPATRRKLLLGGSSEPRRTTKNADHQTVPRFEQLCDLELIGKPEPEDLAARRRWRWRATDAARRWAHARQLLQLDESRFLAEGFARTALHAYADAELGPRCTDTRLIARYLAAAYDKVRRPAGHTPLDSIALIAGCHAIDDGHAIELADFHRLMLAIKQGGRLQGEVFFASGNDLDKMFVMIRADFAHRVAVELPATLPTPAAMPGATDQ